MNAQAPNKFSPVLILWAILPLVLLGLVLWAMDRSDLLKEFQGQFPQVEELAVERAELSPGHIRLQVLNDGPDPITLAQVMVDDAYWPHTVTPGRTLEPRARASVDLDYPWVTHEAYVVKLVTRNGVTFDHEIAIAVQTPKPSARLVGLMAMLGLYVGVIPVAAGLFWFPLLRRLSSRWLDFFLFLTIGLLLFLGTDALEEALELAGALPETYQAIGILTLGLVGAVAGLCAAQKMFGGASGAALSLAYTVAAGIGLHNLSEGLAIGAAYAVGNLALGTMLVVGFALHNTTEGLAIAAPVARQRVSIIHLGLMGLLGGLPTILGAWLGAFTYSGAWSLLFLAVGAGAIFQVAWQIAAQMAQRRGGLGLLMDLPNAVGLAAGILIMYGTGYLVTM